MFVSERSLRRHMPRLIVHPARRAASSADGSLQPVLRSFVQEDPPRSIRRPARSLLASELNPLTRDTEENPVTLGTTCGSVQNRLRPLHTVVWQPDCHRWRVGRGCWTSGDVFGSARTGDSLHAPLLFRTC